MSFLGLAKRPGCCGATSMDPVLDCCVWLLCDSPLFSSLHSPVQAGRPVTMDPRLACPSCESVNPKEFRNGLLHGRYGTGPAARPLVPSLESMRVAAGGLRFEGHHEVHLCSDGACSFGSRVLGVVAWVSEGTFGIHSSAMQVHGGKGGQFLAKLLGRGPPPFFANLCRVSRAVAWFRPCSDVLASSMQALTSRW